jgi:uncharacterized repeat protein (TIGR03833 family)
MYDTNPTRDQLTPGTAVVIIEKQNQPTGIESTGVVKRILSPGFSHPRGIKVMLTDGRVGRVKRIAGIPVRRILEERILMILRKTDALYRSHISEPRGAVDYIGIFPKTQAEREEFLDELNRINAAVAYRDSDGELYRVSPGIIADGETVSLIKICFVPSLYNPNGNKAGYADFQTGQFPQLKAKYAAVSGFTGMTGNGWEILCLADPAEDVSVYIPNIPLSKDLETS